FYASITTTSLFRYYRSYEWPSLVRTAANYRPGFAYRVIQGQRIARSNEPLEAWRETIPCDVVPLLQDSVRRCSSSGDVPFCDQIRLLHDVAQCLVLLARSLYWDLLNRRAIDRRWEQRRRQFRAGMAFNSDSFDLIAPVN